MSEMDAAPSRAPRRVVKSALALLLICTSTAAAADPAAVGTSAAPRVDSLTAPPARIPAAGRPALLRRSDLWWSLGAAAAIGAASRRDGSARHEALESSGPESDGVAGAAQHFGNLLEIAPVLVAGYAIGHRFDRPGLAGASLHVGQAVMAASAASQLIKHVVGRARPYEAGGDARRFDPFSGFDSFPSGHTAIAFAAATAIDRETTSGWVPFAVYPLASVVGWSRVHDDRHWTSDVVAGAALGIWMANKVGSFHRGPEAHAALHPMIAPAGGGVRLGAAIEF
jgi:membrane-associated phospholipid phosphatase